MLRETARSRLGAWGVAYRARKIASFLLSLLNLISQLIKFNMVRFKRDRAYGNIRVKLTEISMAFEARSRP